MKVLTVPKTKMAKTPQVEQGDAFTFELAYLKDTKNCTVYTAPADCGLYCRNEQLPLLYFFKTAVPEGITKLRVTVEVC
jgi:hypothetical protein